MDNFSLFYATCDAFVNNPTYSNRSTDEALATADIKVLDNGFIKLCFRQLIDKQNNIFFFIFHIVQSSNTDKIDFSNNYWENGRSIERIVSVSGDYGNGVQVTTKRAVPDNFQKLYMTTRRIIISPNSSDASMYTLDKTPEIVSVSQILASLEQLDINTLFNGSLKEKEKEKEKEKQSKK